MWDSLRIIQDSVWRDKDLCYKCNCRWTIKHIVGIVWGVKGCFLGLTGENRPLRRGIYKFLPNQMGWRVCSPNTFCSVPGNLAKLHFAASPAIQWGPVIEFWQMECGWIRYTALPVLTLKIPCTNLHVSLVSLSIAIWWVSLPPWTTGTFINLSTSISVWSLPLPSDQPITTVTCTWNMLLSF